MKEINTTRKVIKDKTICGLFQSAVVLWQHNLHLGIHRMLWIQNRPLGINKYRK